MPTPAEQFTTALISHAPEFGIDLSREQAAWLQRYYALVMHWNPRLHLVAHCSAEEFATRHVLESLLLTKHLPQDATVVDVGTGAGLPIIPCLLVRADLRAILIESSQKKTVFLREALRLISDPERAQVKHGRFEEMAAPAADFVTCRALDRFGDLLPAMLAWPQPGTTFLLYVGPELKELIENRLTAVKAELIPLSERRYLIYGRSLNK
jgi:16S rRNA (guanine527-N7)-methyltransferase